MITLNSINVNFGTRTLLDNVTIRVGGKDRVSFVGSNGAGKSTLLKIIAGLFSPDSGNVIISRHTTIGYLPQEGIEYKGRTLFDEVSSAAGDLKLIESELKEAEKEIETAETFDDDYYALLDEYAELQERFNLLDGHKLAAKTEKILKGLGFFESDYERFTEEFSGGWQMRIALAKLLLQNPSILLLDEPTNHLDIESLLWVEEYLKKYLGAIILISHDRNFLNNITTKTFEISRGKVTEYSGNYDKYISVKSERKELLLNQQKNQEKYLKQQNRFVERFRYKASKAKAVQSRIKLLERLERIEVDDEESAIDFDFPAATHSGKITLEAEDITKSYDGKKIVLNEVSFIIPRGEKIAFMGVNGAGKSTLMKIIAGVEPYSGNIKYGHLVQLKFFSQTQAEELDKEKTVLKTIEESAAAIPLKNLRSILGSFLFRGDDVDKKVKVLSGGEKSRLALAKMLVEPSNFLILDEPTNHLDMRSKDVLKAALMDYEGTVIIVSHDREFLDGIVNKIIEVKDNRVFEFSGGLDEFVLYKQSEMKEEVTPSVTAKQEKKVKVNYKKSKDAVKEIKKQINPVKKMLTELEQEISKCESLIKDAEKNLADPEFYKKSDDVKYLTQEYEKLKKKLKQYNSRWEETAEKLNFLEKQLT